MNKFKVGDRVRVIKFCNIYGEDIPKASYNCTMKKTMGSYGTIIQITGQDKYSDNVFNYNYIIDSARYSFTFLSMELELVYKSDYYDEV